MFMFKKPIQAVMGHRIKSPRMTKWAYYYLLVHVALPLNLFLLALDLAFYTILKYGFNKCYGLLCYIQWG